MHIVGKENRRNGKFIRSDFEVQLDVFDNTKEMPREPTYEHLTLRTLLKYQPLTLDNVREVQRIKNDVEQWRKQNAKDENEFANK